MSYCGCDYDAPTVYTVRQPKARKAHTCDECGATINPGEIYEYVSGVWEGRFNTFSTCGLCLDLRQWVQNQVPCLCVVHGNQDAQNREAIIAATERAPGETGGLWFGYMRRKLLRDRRKQIC